MSIMSKIFGSPNTQANQTQVAPAQIPAPGSPASQSPNGAPVTQQTPATDANGTLPKQPESPLKAFEQVWEPNKDANGNPVAPKTPESPVAPIDPAKLQEAVKNLNFAGVITADTLNKISAGGEDAKAAFSQAMNSVAQTVFSQSAVATNSIVEKALQKQADQFKAELPNIVKSLSVREGLREENPMFSNPAVAPILDGLQSQLQLKYPNASAGELQKMAKNYLEGIGATFAPAPKDSDSQNRGGSGGKKSKDDAMDWSTFLE